MARLGHRKARLVRKVRCPNYTGFFIVLSNTPQSHAPQGIQPHFQNRSYPLIINTRKNTLFLSLFLGVIRYRNAQNHALIFLPYHPIAKAKIFSSKFKTEFLQVKICVLIFAL